MCFEENRYSPIPPFRRTFELRHVTTMTLSAAFLGIAFIFLLTRTTENMSTFKLSFGNGYGPETVKQISGYLPVQKQGNLFFWFFESRNDPHNDPLLIWLQGGPGCSSMYALGYENGPYKFQNGKLTLNPFSWNTAANLMYIDNPIDVGFSDGPKDSECKSFTCAANDMYEFLIQFYSNFPKYKQNPLIVSGESYAGHWVSALSWKLYKEEVSNFQGFMIGNGLVNAGIQYAEYFNFGVNMGIINNSDVNPGEMMQNECTKEVQIQQNLGTPCKSIRKLLTKNGAYGIYDFTKPQKENNADEDEAKSLKKLLNDPIAKESLGVRRKWNMCSKEADSHMTRDMYDNWDSRIGVMLDQSKIKVLIYAGENDIMCNWVGQLAWMGQMKWSGREKFNMKTMSVWGRDEGWMKEEGHLKFLKLKNAGHMVPQDQPQASLKMLNEFIQSL